MGFTIAIKWVYKKLSAIFMSIVSTEKAGLEKCNVMFGFSARFSSPVQSPRDPGSSWLNLHANYRSSLVAVDGQDGDVWARWWLLLAIHAFISFFFLLFFFYFFLFCFFLFLFIFVLDSYINVSKLIVLQSLTPSTSPSRTACSSPGRSRARRTRRTRRTRRGTTTTRTRTRPDASWANVNWNRLALLFLSAYTALI